MEYPKEYRAYRTPKNYQVWLTCYTPRGDRMHLVKTDIPDMKTARAIAHRFNAELGIE